MQTAKHACVAGSFLMHLSHIPDIDRSEAVAFMTMSDAWVLAGISAADAIGWPVPSARARTSIRARRARTLRIDFQYRVAICGKPTSTVSGEKEAAGNRTRAMMSKFTYFAYGSNMLTERLRARCPSAQPLGVALAPGYRLHFSKRSRDGSGKATLIKVSDEGQHEVHGVLFEIANEELAGLDEFEGVGAGYDRSDEFVIIDAADGQELTAVTYLASADACDPRLVPYDWYHSLVIAGAEQHRLPGAYVDQLRLARSQPDPRPDRDTRLAALRLLETL